VKMIAMIASLLATVVAAPALALNARSFVATYGLDTNDCSAGYECRTFARALSMTLPDGEVIALTSGGYGPFTVSQGVTVSAATGSASITNTGVAPAISVLAGGADRVVLRGLHVIVTGGASGIVASTFGLLAIENCSVSGAHVGIAVGGTEYSAATITNTVVRHSTANGFQIQTNATLVGCRAEHNGDAGLSVVASAATTTAHVAATGFISHSNEFGVAVNNTYAADTLTLTLVRAVLHDNTSDGVIAYTQTGGTATVRIAESVITENNGYGIFINPGAKVDSLQNNVISGNYNGVSWGTVGTIPPR
jgi:parallel beta helix pectate lyase-like protein